MLSLGSNPSLPQKTGISDAKKIGIDARRREVRAKAIADTMAKKDKLVDEGMDEEEAEAQLEAELCEITKEMVSMLFLPRCSSCCACTCKCGILSSLLRVREETREKHTAAKETKHDP